jgi:4-amino-4-deoxy-L-arabinose transferase-like glycosyltransferase
MISHRLREGPPLALSVTVGLALRLCALLVALPHPERYLTLDGRQYLALARDPVGGYLDQASPIFPVGLIRTPIYPLMAALLFRCFGPHIAAVVTAQVILGVCTAVLCYAIGRATAGTTAGRWAALFFACDAAAILYGNVLQPETLFTALLVGTALLWLTALRRGSARPAAAAGLLLGLATLTRPAAVLLPIALAPLAFVRPRGRGAGRRALALLVPCVVVVSVWVVRNAAVTGVPFLSTISSVNLLYYRAAGALATEQAITIVEARDELESRLRQRLPAQAGAGQLHRLRSELAVQVLREHRGAAARIAADGVLRLFAGSGLTALSALIGDPDPEGLSARWKGPVQVALLAWLGVLYAAAVLGVRSFLSRRAWLEAALPLCFTAALVLVSAGPEANTRFRVPLVPFLAVLAGAGVGRATGPPARDAAEKAH